MIGAAIDVVAAFLRRLPWRQIIVGLAIAGLLYGAYEWAYSRGRHSRDSEVAQLNAAIITAQANADKLDAALKQQNEALLAAAAESAAKLDEGRKALAEVQKANAGLAAQAASLRKSGGVARSADAPCQISKTLAGAKL